MELALEKVLEYPKSLMNPMATEKIDGRIVFDAERAGDAATKEVVVWGWGISAQGKYLTDVLQEKVETMCFGGTIGEVANIWTSELNNDAGIIGAAYLS